MRANPEKFAWRITLAAFTLFLLLCGSVAYSVYWFVFLSYVPIDVALEASRGTIQVTQPTSEEAIAVTDYRPGIEAGMTIQTDSVSQGTLTFSDARTGEPIASVTLFRDSQVELTEARGPRFRPNRSPYIIQASNQVGHTDTLMLEPADNRSVAFDLTTPQTIIRFSGPGLYVVNTTEQETIITTREGLAFIRGQRVNSPVAHLESGERMTVATGHDPLGIPDQVENLLIDSLFDENFAETWDFYNDREPPGQAYNMVFEGRRVTAIDRSQEQYQGQELGHAETGLVQFLNADVSDYRSLEIRATFYVAEQSLSTCGIAGSECPMMVRMVYQDERGVQRVYIHGFYANHDPGLGYPLACDTCRTEHERIAFNTWYTFESGNLMTLLPSGQRPRFIDQVSFYASGHAYLTYISEMSLLTEE